jgi:hypothetical protein
MEMISGSFITWADFHESGGLGLYGSYIFY